MGGGGVMNPPNVSSCLKKDIRDFCILRYGDGVGYRTPIWVMTAFDRFLFENDFQEPYPTRKMIDNYLMSISHLASKTRASYNNPVRQFCKFMAQTHADCYVPDPVRRVEVVHTPYIFTREEIHTLAVGASKLSPQWSLRGETLKTLFTLLYTTGLRVGEARSLNIENFYPENLRLLVRNGKFHKSRWIPIRPSTCAALVHYISLRQERTLLSPNTPLFVSIRNKRIPYNSILGPFRKIFRNEINSDQTPHLHDLRHSFAVACLLRWYRDGKDINSRLPSLATYMGHVEIRSTQAYLHATPELKQAVYQRSLNYVHEHVLDQGEVK